MELILKPTGRCNFDCTYCSAKNAPIKHLENVPSQLKDVLQKMKPSSIIVTGGDPLCNSPEFYYELLSLGDWKLSFTTNLKDYFFHPEKWRPLFKDRRVGVCTSFQYGDGRMWDSSTPYDVSMFKDVFFKFLDDIGYRLKFIAVVSKENESHALDHVLLAKELKTKCKLNGMMPLGKSTEFYPMYKMLKIILDVHEKGLLPHLDIETPLYNGGCGFNTSLLCKSTIRAVMFLPDGTMQMSTCEDDLVNGSSYSKCIACTEDPHKEVISIDEHISPECMFCKLFRLCHGCHQYRKLNKQVPEHCREMKKLEQKILEIGWNI